MASVAGGCVTNACGEAGSPVTACGAVGEVIAVGTERVTVAPSGDDEHAVKVKKRVIDKIKRCSILSSSCTRVISTKLTLNFTLSSRRIAAISKVQQKEKQQHVPNFYWCCEVV
jgi:preprotein translocase subunit YajC